MKNSFASALIATILLIPGIRFESYAQTVLQANSWYLDEVMIQSTGHMKMESITLFDISGKKVAAYKPDASIYKISVSGYPNGIYNLRIETKEGTANRRLTVSD